MSLQPSWSKIRQEVQKNNEDVGFRFGFSLRTVFLLNCFTAQLSYEGRAAVEGASSISKFHHHNINGGAVDDT
jgi:hypothetical protein